MRHEIHECPECGESLVKPVHDPSMKAYLVDRGMSQVDAEAMWKLRQMVHGREARAEGRAMLRDARPVPRRVPGLAAGHRPRPRSVLAGN
jgi:hypothetical protein